MENTSVYMKRYISVDKDNNETVFYFHFFHLLSENIGFMPFAQMKVGVNTANVVKENFWKGGR